MKLHRYTGSILWCLLIMAAPAFAQTSNAILFTENGEKFTVILNGLRQNEVPETNVKVEGLNANFYKVKIIFEDTALGQSNFNMGIEPGTETTYIIKQNNKKAYVMRPMSMVPIAQAPPAATGSTVVTYNPNAAPYVPGETVTQTTTTTTTTSGDPMGEGVSIGMSVNENGGSFSMNVNAFESENTTVTSQQTTTITTSNTTSTAPVYSEPAPAPYVMQGYNGPVGCPYPMLPGDFESVKSTIASKSFEDSKMTIAKQILNNNCLVTNQVKEIMLLFSFEDSRLEFAKFAYGKTFDIGNYYKVNDAFTFESSIEDLNRHITSYRR